MSDSQVTISGVHKVYGGTVEALRGVDLTLDMGLFGLLGPNGAGKTTLMRIIAGLLPPSEGAVSVFGHDPAREPHAVRRSLGYLPQRFGLYPRLTVAEHVAYFCRLKGMDKPAATTETRRLLKVVGLEDVAARKAFALSGGMRQRVGIAVALAGSPRLLIVDEPTVGLDPEERARFRNLLVEYSSDAVVILSTHIVQDIEIGCGRTAIIDAGRVLTQGSTDQLLARADGRIWQKSVPRDQLDTLKRDVVMLSMKDMGNGSVQVRFAADAALEGAEPVRSQLEDAYLYLVGSEAGELA
ncbi:MAG: ATP-binding cassette domain-containing protein [Coriobacteriia bacterium]|nr:ATP-binding cassette domain-containing protein [Coriobacteriia bacterium]